MQELQESESINSAEQIPSEDAPKKVPKWAILVAVLAFIVFNSFFLVFAMQMGGSNTPN